MKLPVFSPIITIFTLLILTTTSFGQNPVFESLNKDGVQMSDGTKVRLDPPILADGLDTNAQQAAIEQTVAGRYSYEKLVEPGYYTPVIVKVHTIKAHETNNQQPAIRTVDVWFAARGDWKKLTSQEFLDSLSKKADEGKSRVVTQAGILSTDELTARELVVKNRDNYEERFVYTTFTLFERVEISITRFSVVSHNEESVLIAGQIDPRFDKDKNYPNQWRPLIRDERAEIRRGPATIYHNAGGYIKITRLKEPTDAIFFEAHIVYEEPYGWFDGVNLVKQKLPAMVQEKVRTLRRKLAATDAPQPDNK